MKQTNFQRKKKIKRMQSIVQKYADYYFSTPDGEKAMFDSYRDALIYGYDEKTNERYKLRVFVDNEIDNELTNI